MKANKRKEDTVINIKVHYNEISNDELESRLALVHMMFIKNVIKEKKLSEDQIVIIKNKISRQMSQSNFDY